MANPLVPRGTGRPDFNQAIGSVSVQVVSIISGSVQLAGTSRIRIGSIPYIGRLGSLGSMAYLIRLGTLGFSSQLDLINTGMVQGVQAEEIINRMGTVQARIGSLQAQNVSVISRLGSVSRFRGSLMLGRDFGTPALSRLGSLTKFRGSLLLGKEFGTPALSKLGSVITRLGSLNFSGTVTIGKPGSLLTGFEFGTPALHRLGSIVRRVGSIPVAVSRLGSVVTRAGSIPVVVSRLGSTVTRVGSIPVLVSRIGSQVRFQGSMISGPDFGSINLRRLGSLRQVGMPRVGTIGNILGTGVLGTVTTNRYEMSPNFVVNLTAAAAATSFTSSNWGSVGHLRMKTVSFRAVSHGTGLIIGGFRGTSIQNNAALFAITGTIGSIPFRGSGETRMKSYEDHISYIKLAWSAAGLAGLPGSIRALALGYS